MSARTDQLRREAKESRERLVATVGQLGGAVDAVKDEITVKARRYAPIAAGSVAGLVLLRALGRRRR